MNMEKEVKFRALGHNFTVNEIDEIQSICSFNSKERNQYAMTMLLTIRGIKCKRDELFEYDGCYYTRNGLTVTHYGRDLKKAQEMLDNDLMCSRHNFKLGLNKSSGTHYLVSEYKDCEGYKHRRVVEPDKETFLSYRFAERLSAMPNHYGVYKYTNKDGETKYYILSDKGGYTMPKRITLEMAKGIVWNGLGKENEAYDFQLTFEDFMEGCDEYNDYEIYDFNIFWTCDGTLEECIEKCKK